MKNGGPLSLSLPLCGFIIIISCVGLFFPDFYAAETINWQAQSLGQDTVDLFLLAPSLLISSLLTYYKKWSGIFIWGGTVFYLTYTFVLYCFDVHFNELFVLYCIALGLSFYSSLYFLFIVFKKSNPIHIENKQVIWAIGIYFIVISVIFCLLWLAEIIPAIVQNKIPKSVDEAGLFTNGVHVLDLSILLPAIFITGVFLLKRKVISYFLVPTFLTFFILMNVTIGVLTLTMKNRGIKTDLTICIIMFTLALISIILLVWFLKNCKLEILNNPSKNIDYFQQLSAWLFSNRNYL